MKADPRYRASWQALFPKRGLFYNWFIRQYNGKGYSEQVFQIIRALGTYALGHKHKGTYFCLVVHFV